MTGLLIVNADDFGYDDHHTDAVLECAAAGHITSTTAMMFMRGSDRAATQAPAMEIGIGLHLNLSEAFDAPDVPADVRSTQERLLRRFDATRARRVQRWIYDPTIQRDVDRSLLHQLERFRELYGREPTHVDGHQHVQVCPNVFLSRVIPRSVKWRRSLDSEHGRMRRLRQRAMDRRPGTRFFFDIEDADPRTPMGPRVLELASTESTEVMCHPGFGHERERLEAPEWDAALADLPTGSYADLEASTSR